MISKTNEVCVVKTASYQQEELAASVKRIFTELCLYEKIKPEMRVLLKPNLVMKRSPKEATTTHPGLLEAVIKELRKIGVREIVIADSPGGLYTKAALSGIYEVCGINRAAKQGAKVNDDFGSFAKKNKQAGLVHEFTLINPVKNADYIINMPKLKTHAMMMLSGAVKNLFGTIPGLMKPEFHWRFPNSNDFADMLLDLCETVSPDVTIIDAVVGMEGDGPTGGTPIDCGVLLASENPYILDQYCAYVVGLSEESVPTIQRAYERGSLAKEAVPVLLGDTDKLSVGFAVPKSKNLNFSEHIPKVFRSFVYKIVTSKPSIKTAKCVGCGKCAESCPAHTIQITNGKAHINYKNCIHCFCCHEMCPIKAIDIKRLSFLFNR